MKNFSFKFTTIHDLNYQLDMALDFNNERTLIQVYCATAEMGCLHEVQNYFSEKFPQATLIGTTTDGIILGDDVFVETTSVVTFTIFEHTTLQSVLVQEDDCFHNSFEMGESIAKALYQDDTKVIISFSDGTHTNGEEYVKGISSICPEIPLAGGMAGDNGKVIQTFIFDHYQITDRGAVAVALNSKVLHLTTNYTFNWLPIGKKMRITKSIKNRVFEIDGMSAVNIYAKYLGEKIAKELPQIGIEFPLVFERNGVDIGRAVIGKNDDGSLVFAGNIDEGTYVRFGIGNVEEILKNSYYSISKMVENMEYKAEAIFVYSCMARRRFMNEYIHDELVTMKNISPVSGFFTYGEFFHTENSNQLLNETMTLLVLSETQTPQTASLGSFVYNDEKVATSAQHAIARLANIVSNELAELNENLEKRVKENSAYIYQQAYFDKLTGLPNRLSLIKQLDQKHNGVIILVNIDDFAAINDFYGHTIGDSVLQNLANILKKIVSIKGGEVFKLPSDEFAIILDIKEDFQTLEKSIKHCLELIEKEEFIIAKHTVNITVTLSAAFINERGSGLINADMALKNAKRNGKPFTVFQEDLQLSEVYEKNIKMANEVRNAILNDRIFPYYQPIFDIKTGKVEKYEALVRLEDSTGKILSPYFFLDVSEKIKLYHKITEIMIEKTFAYFSANGLHFSLNLAFSDMLNDKTRDFLFEKIAYYDIASQLTIEILETQEYEKDEIVKQFIEDVYTHGANVAIDDFGSGYANFEHLTSIHSDIIKIDGSLIKNIHQDKNTRLIVETIIDFVKKLNKKVLAEFVHNKEVYDIVKELGIDYIQGYYLGEPKPQVL